jgi:hypothetical protein
MWLGWGRSWWRVLTAFCHRRWSLSGSPVFGFTSNRGKLLEDRSTRMRWPFLKTFDVGYSLIVYV